MRDEVLISGKAWLPVLAAALLATALLTHWPVRKGFFQVDDFLWLDIANWRSVAWSFVGNQGAHLAYRPIPRLSTYIDATLFGDDATFWHIENVVLHAGNALLLAMLARRWQLPRAVATAAALLFVVSPLSGESVDWISGRTSVLCLTFELLAAWQWTRAMRFTDPDWAMAGWMILAGMTYEAAFVLPVQLACLIPLACRVPRANWRHALRQTVFLVAVLALFMVLRAAFIGSFVGQTDRVSTDLIGNFRLQLSTLGVMSLDLAGPVTLGLLAAAFMAASLSRRLRPAGPCLAMVAAVSLAPYAQVTGTGGRFYYALQAPLCVLLTLPALLVPVRHRTKMLAGLLAVVLPGFAVQTWRESVRFTLAGIATRDMVEAVRRAIPADNGTNNVIDGIPEMQGGRIMMGDYFELGLAYFYKSARHPLIMRTRTVLFYPQISSDVLSETPHFWRYDVARNQVRPITRQDWLTAHPEALAQQHVWCRQTGHTACQ